MSDIEIDSELHPVPHEVSKDNLPLSCPMPEMPIWNAHPKVFLDIEKVGRVVCPYCGTLYTLK